MPYKVQHSLYLFSSALRKKKKKSTISYLSLSPSLFLSISALVPITSHKCSRTECLYILRFFAEVSRRVSALGANPVGTVILYIHKSRAIVYTYAVTYKRERDRPSSSRIGVLDMYSQKPCRANYDVYLVYRNRAVVYVRRSQIVISLWKKKRSLVTP